MLAHKKMNPNHTSQEHQEHQEHQAQAQVQHQAQTKSTKFNKTLHWLTASILFFCASFILTLGYWLTWPYNVMQIQSIQVLTPTIEVGDLFEYTMHYCKDQRYEALYSRLQHSFTDGLIYNMPVEYGPLPAGCNTTIVSLVVPALPEGDYKLKIRREYMVNPVRTITVEFTSEMFHVTSRRRLQLQLEQQLPKVLPKVGVPVPAPVPAPIN